MTLDDAVIMTLGTARPDRDEGEVGYRQNLWMESFPMLTESKISAGKLILRSESGPMSNFPPP
jgi:hypothetical protein